MEQKEKKLTHFIIDLDNNIVAFCGDTKIGRFSMRVIPNLEVAMFFKRIIKKDDIVMTINEFKDYLYDFFETEDYVALVSLTKNNEMVVQMNSKKESWTWTREFYCKSYYELYPGIFAFKYINGCITIFNAKTNASTRIGQFIFNNITLEDMNSEKSRLIAKIPLSVEGNKRRIEDVITCTLNKEEMYAVKAYSELQCRYLDNLDSYGTVEAKEYLCKLAELDKLGWLQSREEETPASLILNNH